MDYKDRLSLDFGIGNTPTSLGSIFDCLSSQWDRTSLSAKIKVLKPMLDSGYTLKDWVSDYTSQYMTTHSHVIGAIHESIKNIYNYSQDQDLNVYLMAWFIESTSISDSKTQVL